MKINDNGNIYREYTSADENETAIFDGLSTVVRTPESRIAELESKLNILTESYAKGVNAL